MPALRPAWFTDWLNEEFRPFSGQVAELVRKDIGAAAVEAERQRVKAENAEIATAKAQGRQRWERIVFAALGGIATLGAAVLGRWQF